MTGAGTRPGPFLLRAGWAAFVAGFTRMPEVLFICTGNYFRSRYAEALFNHEAVRRGLGWRAFSRGVAIHLAPPGGLSPYTRERMKQREIPHACTGPWPEQLGEIDLQRAARAIALKESEHRPLIAKLQPAWENKIEYWTVDDLDVGTAENALDGIEKRVAKLLATLSAKPPVA